MRSISSDGSPALFGLVGIAQRWEIFNHIDGDDGASGLGEVLRLGSVDLGHCTVQKHFWPKVHGVCELRQAMAATCSASLLSLGQVRGTRGVAASGLVTPSTLEAFATDLHSLCLCLCGSGPRVDARSLPDMRETHDRSE